MKFSKQADYIGWVTATLSKYTKISIETSSNFFLQRILKKQKKELKLVSRPCFSYSFLDRIFPFIILTTLVKFHYQIALTSQVIQ